MYFLFLLAIVFLFDPEIASGTVSVQTSESYRVMIQATTCEELKTEIFAFVRWKETRGEDVIFPEIDCIANPKLREFNVLSLLPAKAQDRIGVETSFNGPNCFNWVLMENGFSRHFCYANSAEWTFHLRNYCRMRDVTQGEEPEPGDVVAIREKFYNGSIGEVHGMVFIGQTVCTKNGYSRWSPCRIAGLDQTLSYYHVPENPECRKTGKIPPSHCSSFVNYYHCSKEYAKDLEETRDFQNFSSELTKSHIDAILSAYVQTGSFSLSLDGFTLILEQLAKLTFTDPRVVELRKELLRSFEQQIEWFRGGNRSGR